MIELMPARPEDTPALVRLWNDALGPDFPLTERLLRQTLDGDPYFEPAGHIVARDGERLAGWVLAKSMQKAGPEMGRFQNRGGIGALCVHPDYQRRGLASRLLNAAETHLREHGSPASTLYFPHHLLPGIPENCSAAVALFQKRGYTGFRACVDLWRDLDDYEVPDQVRAALAANPNVEIRPARAEESPSIIDMVAREFPGGWTYSTQRHFRDGGAAHDLIIAVEGGEVIGFCHTADRHSRWLLPSTYWHPLLGENYGGLGPVGLAAAHRKRGLGLALTALAVADLQRRGVSRMGIDWTTLIGFYEKLGFKVWKRYLQAERAIC